MSGSFITLLIITLAALFPRDFYCFIRPISCLGTDIILISSVTVSMLLLGNHLSREVCTLCMRTYVLFQYSILRDIVSKTSESLIRRVVNLGFRFVYISYPVAVYTLCVIYAYNIIVLFQYLNNVSFNKFYNSISVSLPNQKNKIYLYYIFLESYHYTYFCY